MFVSSYGQKDTKPTHNDGLRRNMRASKLNHDNNHAISSLRVHIWPTANHFNMYSNFDYFIYRKLTIFSNIPLFSFFSLSIFNSMPNIWKSQMSFRTPFNSVYVLKHSNVGHINTDHSRWLALQMLMFDRT